VTGSVPAWPAPRRGWSMQQLSTWCSAAALSINGNHWIMIYKNQQLGLIIWLTTKCVVEGALGWYIFNKHELFCLLFEFYDLWELRAPLEGALNTFVAEGNLLVQLAIPGMSWRNVMTFWWSSINPALVALLNKFRAGPTFILDLNWKMGSCF
jgi:hypothetical protein